MGRIAGCIVGDPVQFDVEGIKFFYCMRRLTCCDVQHVSGLPSVRYFLPTDLSRVELTLE